MRLVRASSFAVALGIACASPSFAQSTWIVDGSAVPPGNGTPASPYTSIQYAHDQASTLSGDTLLISPGTYTEHVQQSPFKALTYLAPFGPTLTKLTGGFEASTNVAGLTTLHGLGFTTGLVQFFQADVLMIGCTVTDIDQQGVLAGLFSGFGKLTMEGCTVSGNAAGGVGTLNCQLTLRMTTFADNGPFGRALTFQGGSLLAEDCWFVDNHAVDSSGGALEASGQQVTLRDCTFQGNSAYLTGRMGGAVFLVSGPATIEDCTFRDNRSDMGGAIAVRQTATLEVRDSEFEFNVAVRDGTGMFPGQGGAIVVLAGGALVAEDCLFEQNSAPVSGFGTGPGDQLGGAIAVEGSGSILRRCTFTGNSAHLGGAVLHGPAELEQCVLLHNLGTAEGATVQGGAVLDRCTVVHNDPAPGSAAVVDSTVTSSIVWANANGQLGGSSSATYSCIQGGAAGIGNIAGDPQFVDLGNDLVSLTMASPCIDAANPSAPLDADLTPADMGALPFTWLPIGTSYCVANPNSSGQTAAIQALGSTSVAADFLRVQATRTAVDQLGLFMMSQNQGFVPFFNGSQGNLCVSAPIVRLTNTPGSVSTSGPQGLLNLRVKLNTLPAGLQILPGQTWHFQSWFRDHVGGNSTSNTSDAVSVTFQ